VSLCPGAIFKNEVFENMGAKRTYFQNAFSKREVLKISEQERGESFENIRTLSKMLRAFLVS